MMGLSEDHIPDAGRAAWLYRSMPVETLADLRFAFEGDRDRATSPHTVAFCEGRLRLIAAEFERRRIATA